MNNETLTKCICHKGFSEYSSIVARSNIRVGGQGTTPQSLTAHTLDRYQIFIKPNSMIEEFTLWSTIQTKSKCYVIKKY